MKRFWFYLVALAFLVTFLPYAYRSTIRDRPVDQELQARVDRAHACQSRSAARGDVFDCNGVLLTDASEPAQFPDAFFKSNK